MTKNFIMYIPSLSLQEEFAGVVVARVVTDGSSRFAAHRVEAWRGCLRVFWLNRLATNDGL